MYFFISVITKTFRNSSFWGIKQNSQHVLNICVKIQFASGTSLAAEDWFALDSCRQRPAVDSLLGDCCSQKAYTDGGHDWIQIRFLWEVELHSNEGFLRDRGRADPSLPATTTVYIGAGQTERLSPWWSADPWGLFPAITAATLLNSDILRSCKIFSL